MALAKLKHRYVEEEEKKLKKLSIKKVRIAEPESYATRSKGPAVVPEKPSKESNSMISAISKLKLENALLRAQLDGQQDLVNKIVELRNEKKLLEAQFAPIEYDVIDYATALADLFAEFEENQF